MGNENKWFWMMDYCKEHELPLAQQWAWEQAEKAWDMWKARGEFT